MPHIKVKGVSKYYGRVKALQKVDLDISDKEYVVLLGPSGCGKTTLLKIIAGIEYPSEGAVAIGSKDVTAIPPEDRDIGFLFQNYALFPHMTVLDNTSYGMIARGERAEKSQRKALEMLRLVRLEGRNDAFPRQLSGGMQQRLAMARALATGSKILFLDEPMNALDAYIRMQLRVELRLLCKKMGLTAIHVTHDQEEAMALADKIVIMKGGRIQQVGSPKDVYMHPANPFVAGFLGEANFLRVKFERGRASLLGQEVRAKFSGEYVAVLRPEHLCLGNGGVDVEIVNTRLLGPFFRYEVDYHGLRLVVRATHAKDKATHLTFKPKDIIFFKEPQEGLEKAISID